MKFNYIVSYNVFKGEHLVGAGDAFYSLDGMIISAESYNKLRQSLTEKIKEEQTDFTFVQIICVNFLGSIKEGEE